MSNEIQLYTKLQDPIGAIKAIGQMFAKSCMFGCDRPEQGEVLAMICLAENKSPVAITRDYHIVEGKLSKKALAALADFRMAGGKHKWLSSGDVANADPAQHFAEIELTDKAGNTLRYKYSMADAKAENLLRPNSRWTKRPGNMLRARCISNGLGMLCPELYAGDDSESEPTQGPEIAMAPAVTSEPKRGDSVTVEIVPDLAVTQQPKRAIAVAPAAVVDIGAVAEPVGQPTPPAAAQPGTLPADLCAQVESAIGEHAIAAIDWMVKNGWLQKGQGVDHLAVGHARRIVKQREGFLRVINGK